MESGAFYGRSLIRSFLAGVAIAIGGCVLIGCTEAGYRWVGAILFSIGLMTVFNFGLDLYTGKVGYLAENKADYVVWLFVMILGNFIGALFVGLMFPSDTAAAWVDAKLDLGRWDLLFKGIMCGMLMFIAADFYKERKSFLATFFCVPVFILAGFEHSIADMFYVCSAGIFNADTLIMILIVLLGNGIGGVIIPLCRRYMYEPGTDPRGKNRSPG